MEILSLTIGGTANAKDSHWLERLVYFLIYLSYKEDSLSQLQKAFGDQKRYNNIKLIIINIVRVFHPI